MLKEKFSTLKDLQDLAASLPESPEVSNDNRLHPDFLAFYKKTAPHFWEHFFEWIFKIDKGGWSVAYFTSLLKKITSERVLKGYEGDYIQKLVLTEDAEVILFGDLHAAFHSLVRDLSELHRLGIISNELKIEKSHYYMVFNGNVIDSSPFNLPTLFVVLLLLSINPTQVFYIRGSHENKEEWHNFSFKQELQWKTANFLKELIPLNAEINAFFDTLPLALYLKITSGESAEFVRLSHQLEVHETNFASFLLERDEKAISELKIKEIQFQKKLFSLKLSIRGIDRRLTYRPMRGFEIMSEEEGSMVCSLFSSPTPAFQELYGFYYDAFAQFKCKNWTLDLFSQDVRDLKGYVVETYNLSAQTRSFKGTDEIVLGCTLDLSKASSFLGLRLKEGISLCTRMSHQSADAGNKRILPIFLDDEYIPHKAKKNVQEFLNLYHTDLVFSPLGTPTTGAFYPLAIAKQILILFPYTGASIFRQPEVDHIMHFRASYADEAEGLVYHAIFNLQIKKFAIFYQDDAYGLAGLEGAKRAFAKYNIESWIEVPYLRSSPNIHVAAKTIYDYNPESIIFISTYAPSVALTNVLTPAKLHNKILMGVSFLTDLFRDFLKSKGLPFIISRVVPDCTKTELEIVSNYQKAMQKYNKSNQYTLDSLEGFINTSLFIEMIKQIDPPVTKEKIIECAHQFKIYSFQGLTLDFNPNTKTFFNKVWIDSGEQEWIEFISSRG